MTAFFYTLITLNGILTAILGRRPIAIDKTKHPGYRLLGVFEATIFPATFVAMLLVAAASGLGWSINRDEEFFKQHAGMLYAVRISVLGVYLIAMIVGEKAIRARIRAGR
ncbi:MAG: hypothetical protein QM783_18380 [Phycisphaerales bacterium]